MFKKIFFYVAVLLLSSSIGKQALGQDAAFSQFYNAPTFVNPSMIGFSTAPRFILNFRHQQPDYDNAFMTVGASYDQHFEKYNSSLGLHIMTDRMGDGIYYTNAVSGLYAYQLPLTQQLTFKLGAQLSFLQQGIDYDKLLFASQIDPNSGPISGGLPSYLEGGDNNINRFDIGLGGVVYTQYFFAGAAFKHITEPNINFFDSDDNLNNLPMLASFHIGHVFYFGDERTFNNDARLFVSPSLFYAHQGDFDQVNVGFQAGKGALLTGLHYRHNFANSDAVIAMLGFRTRLFRLGYSYDINVSSLETTAAAHELSLIFDMGNNPLLKRRENTRRAAQCPEVF